MPKIRGLTQKQRDEQAVEAEIQRAVQDFLRAVGLKRGLEDKTYAELAAELGVSQDRLQKWRKEGALPKAGFGRVVAAYAKMGYRLVPEPITAGRKESANENLHGA